MGKETQVITRILWMFSRKHATEKLITSCVPSPSCQTRPGKEWHLLTDKEGKIRDWKSVWIFGSLDKSLQVSLFSRQEKNGLSWMQVLDKNRNASRRGIEEEKESQLSSSNPLEICLRSLGRTVLSKRKERHVSLVSCVFGVREQRHVLNLCRDWLRREKWWKGCVSFRGKGRQRMWWWRHRLTDHIIEPEIEWDYNGSLNFYCIQASKGRKRRGNWTSPLVQEMRWWLLFYSYPDDSGRNIRTSSENSSCLESDDDAMLMLSFPVSVVKKRETSEDQMLLCCMK